MKIAIYSIAKNEERVAQRFADSVNDADYKVVVDTGSTDSTVSILRDNGISVVETKLDPFRFDQARNISLSNLPDDIDIAVALDLDDVLIPNWRSIIEKYWKEGSTTRLLYLYNLYPYDNEDEPSIILRGFKVHCPKTYRWVDPVHEWLDVVPGAEDNYEFINDVIVEHYPYRKESRDSRIELLKLGTEEDPESLRLCCYYGEALFEKKLYEDAIREFMRGLYATKAYMDGRDISVTIGRSNICKHMAFTLMELNADPDEVMQWLLRAVSEYPYNRETWFELAKGWKAVGEYLSAYACAKYGMRLEKEDNCARYHEWCWDDRANSFLLELKTLAKKS